MARTFEDLIIWQKARHLVGECFDLTELPALERRWSFNNQLTSAALSVMNNIAEGFARGSDRQFAHFLRISMASAAEVRSMFYVMLDRDWISPDQFEELRDQVTEISAGTQSLISYLERSGLSGPPQSSEVIRDAPEWVASELPQSFLILEENSGTGSSASAVRTNSEFEEPDRQR